LTDGNLLAAAAAIADTLRLGPDDVCLNVMPMYHVHGLVAGLLASLSRGACVVCPAKFHAVRFFEWLATYTPTWYTAVPAMHQAVLERADAQPDVVLSSRLRFVRSSSAALPPAVARK